jgi:foldase protein PrsA
MPHLIKKQSKEKKNNPKRHINPERRTRRISYIIVSLVIVAAIVLVGVAYYQQYVAPFQQVIIAIDSVPTIKMRYFLERAKLASTDGLSTIQNLTNEEVLKLAETEYGISISQEDVNKALRNQAAGSDNTTISDVEFNEWYRQLLNENKVTDKVFRDMVAASLRAQLFQEYVNKTIPESLDHVHVYAIFVSTYDEALNVKNRIDSGEDFGKVAREVSIDQTSGELGGELGWIPKGVQLFNNDPFSLEVGKVSDVLAIVDESSTDSSSSSTPTVQAYYVEIVTEIDKRTVDSYYLSEVQNTAYQQWLNDETQKHDVDWKYNSSIDAWVSWQLSKLSTTTAATTTTGG